MRTITTAVFLFIAGYVYGQKKQCYCASNTLMNTAIVSCETIMLKTGAKLYWQYNCNKVWLTLEGTQGKKVVLDEVEVALFPYTYRLGYHLIKEYQSTLLFRSGCGATGPCIYTLVDKSTGKKVQKFTQLICIDTDARLANSRPYAYNFVVYFSENYDSLNVYFIDTKKSLKTSFDIRNNKVTSVIPEHQFISMSKTDNVVTLTYKNDDNISRKLKINVANAKYHR